METKKTTIIVLASLEAEFSIPDGPAVLLVPENGNVPVSLLTKPHTGGIQFRCYDSTVDAAEYFEAGKLAAQYPGAAVITRDEDLKKLFEKTAVEKAGVKPVRKRTKKTASKAEDEKQKEAPVKASPDFMPKPEDPAEAVSRRNKKEKTVKIAPVAKYLPIIRSVRGTKKYENAIMKALQDSDEITCDMKIRMALAEAGAAPEVCGEIAEQVREKVYPGRRS